MDASILDKLDHFEKVSRHHLSERLDVFDTTRPAALSSIAENLYDTDLYNIGSNKTGSSKKPRALPPPAAMGEPDGVDRAGNPAGHEQTGSKNAGDNQGSTVQSSIAGEFEAKIRQAYEAGVIMGQKKNAADQRAFGDSIGATLASFSQSLETLRKDITQEQSDFATDILKKLLPASMKTRAGYEILALIRTILENTARKKVEIHLPPEMVPEFSNALGPYRDHIALCENTAVKPGTSRMKWQGGGADIDVTEAVRLCIDCLNHRSDHPSDRSKT